MPKSFDLIRPPVYLVCKGWAIKPAPPPQPSTIYCATSLPSPSLIATKVFLSIASLNMLQVIYIFYLISSPLMAIMRMFFPSFTLPNFINTDKKIYILIHIHIHTIDCSTPGTTFLITWHTLTVETTILIDTYLITWSIKEAFIKIWKKQFELYNISHFMTVTVNIILIILTLFESINC
jgi:hypothetical protein